jgi:hypothetical protein
MFTIDRGIGFFFYNLVLPVALTEKYAVEINGN